MSIKEGLKIFFYNLKTDKNYQLGLVAFILILGASFVWTGVWYNLSYKIEDEVIIVNKNVNQNINTEIVEYEEIIEKEARRIDGVMVPKDQINRYPLAVMIENLASEQVRPQFGLSKAQVVYEVVVEAGITRFLAVYADEEELERIGPVRSARPTFLEFVSEYNSLYAHAGGSPESLAAIDGLEIIDCSALYGDSRFFWRDNARFSPHNLFSSQELLTRCLRDKELLYQEPEFDSWLFKDEESSEDSEDKNLQVNFSSAGYAVEWKYDQKNNVYKRYNGGEEHKDALTDKIITSKNVIVQIVPPAISAGDDGRVNFDVTGEGLVYIFRDGQKLEGTWKKEDRLARTKFYDPDDEEIALNRGNIWIEILPEDQSFVDNF